MRFTDIIEKKKNKLPLSESEIHFWIKGVVSGEIPDYQTSAILMAIVLNGMDENETAILADAMVHSGDIIDLSEIVGIKVDKHSTGGVGDKTSLVLAALVASCGLKVAKMSGRGLGHTGGTLDKLESIEGFNCFLSEEEFKDQVDKIGISIIGQTGELVPADKKLYELRDVTATVNSVPLIASSIMSKKIASGADIILLDVKYGEGAFMKTVEEAKKLANTMISIGKKLNKKTIAMITDMNQPLGNTIGNALEVKEAVDTLKGDGPKDLTELCVKAGEIVLVSSGVAKSKESAEKMIEEAIFSGKAFDKFVEMVEAQGGNINQVLNTDFLPKSKYKTKILSQENGYISEIHSLKLGVLAMQLGAGRETKEDKINHSVGLELNVKKGEKISKDDLICTVYHDKALSLQWEENLQKAFEFSQTWEKNVPIVEEIME